MFRTQLYDPLTDPERPEYYEKKSLLTNTNEQSINSSINKSIKSIHFQTFKSILCRLLMISYSLLLIIETSILFEEKLILLNISFLFLIIIDCMIIIYARNGLEDRWCSLSILFFICANSVPFWLLEINYGSFLSTNIFNLDFIHHIDTHYKQLNDSRVVLNEVKLKNGLILNSDLIWTEGLMNEKENYSAMLEKHEALFCFILIISRIFIPQATLTWSAISSLSEFSFNTLLDIYLTMNLCRDARHNLPKKIVISSFIISNGALLPISLNILPDSDCFIDRLKISTLRKLTDNFYFRLIVQIILADLPFLCLRLVILSNLKYVKKEMYYLIAKQFIIIFVKLTVMFYNWIKSFVDLHSLIELSEINNLNVFHI